MNMMNRDEFHDVTFVLDQGRTFGACRAWMASGSQYFRDVLAKSDAENAEEAENVKVNVRDISEKLFREIWWYAHTGSCGKAAVTDWNAADWTDLLVEAKRFTYPLLVCICRARAMVALTPETLVYCWKQGTDNGFVRSNGPFLLTLFPARDDVLTSACEKFASDDVMRLMATDAFLNDSRALSLLAALAHRLYDKKRSREDGDAGGGEEQQAKK